MLRFAVQAVLVCYVLAAQLVTAGERLSPEKLWDLARIGDAAVSPDGKHLAYLVTRYDLEENGGKATLMLAEMPSQDQLESSEVSTAFGTPLLNLGEVALLSDVKGLHGLSWFNHSSGAKLVYTAPDGAEEPVPQAWMIDPAGGEPVQLTKVEDGIGNLKVSPAGNAIAFTVDVKMDPTVNELHKDLPKADARIIDSLLYRHWNAWHDYAYSHVHVVKIDDAGAASEPVDLMSSLKADCPVPPFGGSEQFEFSPDGAQMALTLKLVNNPAESTDTGVYLVSIDGGSLQHITPGMPGYDMEPTFSPDGQTLAFHSMERASFEADRNRILLYDLGGGGIREVTSGLDQTAHSSTWSNDGKSIYFYSEWRGTNQIFNIDVESSSLEQISDGRFNFSIVGTVAGSDLLVAKQMSMLRPTELALIDPKTKSVVTITDVNGAMYADLELPTIEERFFTATDGKQIQNWVILPPDFDKESPKQWPMLTYCQGGPQGQIGQWFSYRWNFHMMAAKGYVVLAVNRRGLPGFGREWNDQISGDWGGQAMQDNPGVNGRNDG